MLGISVFLNEPITNETKDYINLAKQMGAKGIFSSIHIPENNVSLYKERLTDLGKITKDLNLSLMVDISKDSLNKAGFSFNNLSNLKEIGVTGLRMDYGISTETIAKASNEITVGLNASTITKEFINDLKKYNANFSSFEMWHNYYPREDTGLDKDFFLSLNKFLKNEGFKVVAFVPGDKILRGPVFKGLPTIEDHRYETTYFSFIDMATNYLVDNVYIGDPEISLESFNKINNWIKTKTIELNCNMIETDPTIKNFVLGFHQNRPDFSKKVIRSANARFLQIPFISPNNNIKRKIGSVTIDNVNYGRYTGEIQICKENLDSDDRVNVIGNIVEEDISLLSLIKSNVKFQLKEV